MAKTRRTRQAERSRQDILDAAARVFARSGYRGATMNDIAREAEYSAPTLYSYFKKKRDILDSLISDTLDAMLLAFDRPIPPDVPLRARLGLLMLSFDDLMEAHLPAVIAMFKLHTDGIDDGPIPNAQAMFLSRLTDWFTEHAQPGETRYPPETLAWVFFGLAQGYELHWLNRWADATDRPPLTEKSQEILDIFFEGTAR